MEKIKNYGGFVDKQIESNNTSQSVNLLHGIAGGMSSGPSTSNLQNEMLSGNQETFTQKSNSIRMQMQVLNDKLFETDKLRLQQQKQIGEAFRNNTNGTQNSLRGEYKLLEQKASVLRSEERKPIILGKTSPDIQKVYSSSKRHMSSPYKENFNPSAASRGGGDTVMRVDSRAIASNNGHNRSQSSSMDNCGTEKASAYRSIARLDDTQKSKQNQNIAMGSSDQTTQGVQTLGETIYDGQRIIQHEGAINEQLNQSCSESKIVQMTLSKYITEPNMQNQSPSGIYSSQRAREVLTNIMMTRNTLSSERLDPNTGITVLKRAQLGNFVIPETSLEVSISKQSKNTGSNQLENTKQGRNRFEDAEAMAICSGIENSKSQQTIPNGSSKHSSEIKPSTGDKIERSYHMMHNPSARNNVAQSYLDLHQISQQKGPTQGNSEGQLETSNFHQQYHQNDNYRDFKKGKVCSSMLTTNNNSRKSVLMKSEETHQYFKNSSNSGANFNSNKHLKQIDQVSLSPKAAQARSSYSNLTNNGKSEPICSEVETQRQTVISNFQQFNQERLNDMAAVDHNKQLSSNSINRMVSQNPVFQQKRAAEEAKIQYRGHYDPFEQGAQEVNETCFFKDASQRPFENTRSHDALFQSSLGGGRLLTEVQEEIAQLPQKYERASNFKNGSIEFQRMDSGQVKILRKNKRKKPAITSINSPKDKSLGKQHEPYNSQSILQNRSISQIQTRSILGLLVGNTNHRFSSNKRDSYKSVNQLYHNSQAFLSNHSKSRKKNHDIIKDKIKLQNYKRDLSNKSAFSEPQIRYSIPLQDRNSGMNLVDEPVYLKQENFHNHLSSVQNFNVLPHSNSNSQMRGGGHRLHSQESSEQRSYRRQQVDRSSMSYIQNESKKHSEPRHSTNTWSQLMTAGPNGLPDQIHQADGFIRLSNENFGRYLQKDEQKNYNTQNIQDLNILKNFQSSLKQQTGKSFQNQADPSKNLRNFFIQSSLTFNGNNLNTRQSKTKSISIGGASEEHDKTYGVGYMLQTNELDYADQNQPYYENQINEMEEAESEDAYPPVNANYMPRMLNSQSQSGIDSNYRSNSQFQQTQSQSHSNQNLSRQNSVGTHQQLQPNGSGQNGKRPGTFQAAGTGGFDSQHIHKVNQLLYKKQFQTHQERDKLNEIEESSVYYQHAPQTTSGFLSRGVMGALGLESGSIQNQNNHQIAGGDSSEIINAAIEPMSVFDLPSALQEIQRAFVHIEELRGELEQSNLKYSQIKQEAAGFTEQAVNQNNQIIIQRENINALQEQNQFLQNLIQEKDQKIEELEQNAQFFSQKDAQIQYTIDKLKTKYKQKLLEKEGELGQSKVESLQLQQQCNEYAQEIERLQCQNPVQINGSFGGYPQGTHQMQQPNSEYSEEKSPQIGIIADSQRDAGVQAQQLSQPPINMHMEMNLSPMTKEIEKLRTYITSLVDHMAKSNTEQQPPSQFTQLKELFNHENRELRHKLKSYKERVYKLQRSNDSLQIENGTITQKMHLLKKEMLDLKMQCQDVEMRLGNDQMKQQSTYQQKAKELEERLIKEKVNKYQSELNHKQQLLDLTKKYDSQLRDMRAALGFCFGIADLNQNEVPQYLSEKLTQEIPPTIHNEDLERALTIFQKVFKKSGKQYMNNKFVELKNQYQNLLTEIQKEQQIRRRLMNQLQEYKGNVRVLCRVIPTRSKKSNLQCISSNKIETLNYGNSQTKTFKFDKVFDQDCTQRDIFEEVQDVIQSAVEGYNVCIMSYGQTGSGKTYTMVGDDRNPGLYFCAVDEIYNIIRQKENRVDYELSVSVIEIYNEHIKDLLQKDQRSNDVKLLEDSAGDLYGGQVKRKVNSKNQILKALRDACINRTTGVTQFNEKSSRSHFIMTIFIRGYDGVTRQTFEGKLSLVDLAGSERILKSNAEGIRKVEAQHINKSLATLGKVFLNLQNHSNHIPFRDSKLTHYLRDSIGGNAKTMMILQISPSMKDHTESVSTLTFGQRVQEIRKGAITRRSHSRKRSTSFKKKPTFGLRSASACSGNAKRQQRGSLSSSLLCSKNKRSSSKKMQGCKQLSRSMVKLSSSKPEVLAYKDAVFRKKSSIPRFVPHKTRQNSHERIKTEYSTEIYQSESSQKNETDESAYKTMTQRSKRQPLLRNRVNLMNVTEQTFISNDNSDNEQQFFTQKNSGRKDYESNLKSHKKAKLLQELDQVHRLISDIDQKIEKQALNSKIKYQ